jgi:glycosyltransferase involved in cell wall biosynthesis
MRVLHLYAGNLFGGIERTLLTLWRARRCAPQMYPHFALCFNARLARELRKHGAPVDILGDVRLGLPWTAMRARKRLRDVLERGHFDVALAHSLWPHVVFAPAVRDARVPLVTWLHDVPGADGWLEWLVQRDPPDLMLANSCYTASRAAEMFVGVPVELQYPPVELPPVQQASARTECDRFVILIASRLQPSKGHAILIDALSILPQALDWGCWIAGCPQRATEREYADELHRRALSRGVAGTVHFLGQRDDVPHLLARADVLCQPNTEPEGFGLTFVEALAVGTPVITTDLGAARELIDGTGGVLVGPNDPRAVAAAIAGFAGHGPPRPYSNILKNIRSTRPASARAWEAGRARVEQMCGVERALPRLAAALARACEGRTRWSVCVT